MALYELEYDEGIVLQSTTAMLGGASEEEFENEELMELVVTNKRIIYVVEISTGVFSKAKTEVRQVPISSIKVINGVPQVKQVKHDMWGHSVQVQFVHGVEYWTLEKKKISEWVSEISRLLIGEPKQIIEEPVYEEKKKISAFGAVVGIASTLKNAAETATQTVSTAIKQVSEETRSKLDTHEKPTIDDTAGEAPIVVTAESTPLSVQVEGQSIVQATEEKKFMFCCNCGEKLTIGSKFCNACGNPTGVTEPKNKELTEEPVNSLLSSSTQESFVESINERKVIYEGELHKCPNCGELLESFVVNCPSCGHELRGTKNSTTVGEFATKLEAIEKTRPEKKFGFKTLIEEVNETDLQKISLIRNFIIPNTKEDMMEFLVLALSNINLNRYNELDRISESQKAVSDAWEAKFEQAYVKAKISFGDSAEFKRIESIYENKNKQIQKSKKNRVWMWICLPVGIVALVAIMLFIAFSLTNLNDAKIKTENARLESIVEEVYDALEDENYVLARIKATTLIFSAPYSPEAEEASEKWDKRREELLEIISSAETTSENDAVSKKD